MKRRKFFSTAAIASALPLSCAAGNKLPSSITADDKEIYEIRIYEMKFGGNQNLLLEYLNNALAPALKRAGANHFKLFTEVGNSGPKKIWGLISYPNALTYINAQNLRSDEEFVSSATAYNAAENAIFNRYSSWLLHAFDGMKQMMDPVEGASVYEIRTYEGYSEDAVRRKIKMFNDEEIPLFLKVGLNPIFFGDMIAGPYRPSLTYMLNYKDMDAHGAAWQAFLQHPDWNAMKVKPIYANTVSNIRNVFLKPM